MFPTNPKTMKAKLIPLKTGKCSWEECFFYGETHWVGGLSLAPNIGGNIHCLDSLYNLSIIPRIQDGKSYQPEMWVWGAL